MKLIGSLTSPYVRKIRILLAEENIPYEFILDDVWSTDSFIQQYNPLGQVPCLVLDNGYTLYDSRVIEDFLEEQSPLHAPYNSASRLEVKKWAALADGLTDAAVKIRIETMRPKDKQWQDWIDRQQDKLTRGLAVIEEQLTHHLWCANNAYSVADVATVCLVDFLDFRLPSFDWRAHHPNVNKLADYLNAQPAFLNTLPRLA
ncbi:glutathione S-transferase N-terminal domain-containing protein [Hydromonas duriensis]|uniref:Glutathione S-transferase n=1 Tax=Hydromonas duriensis TaxID=1527608 RepID=A0A4R6Y7U1_9BURK|nr:glutathione S-transferase N-terminal domain-containing protein [Hydromonas duriensis]TDR31422.1 glutathione S-transferase [Hydromonas duriensis]